MVVVFDEAVPSLGIYGETSEPWIAVPQKNDLSESAGCLADERVCAAAHIRS